MSGRGTSRMVGKGVAANKVNHRQQQQMAANKGKEMLMRANNSNNNDQPRVSYGNHHEVSVPEWKLNSLCYGDCGLPPTMRGSMYMGGF